LLAVFSRIGINVKVLLNEQQLANGVRRLAADVRETYGQQPLTILGVMTGSVMLLADLVRMLEMPLRVGVVQASSYRGGMKPGELFVDSRLMPDITGRDVLIIDDIFDTGRTMVKLCDLLQSMNPRSLRTAVLLFKDGCQKVDLRPDFVTFNIPNEFVVGYGLDYEDEYRNLPYVGVLEEEDLLNHRHRRQMET
jgi:hypoxanthine phosphoribosyltransferase